MKARKCCRHPQNAIGQLGRLLVTTAGILALAGAPAIAKKICNGGNTRADIAVSVYANGLDYVSGWRPFNPGDCFDDTYEYHVAIRQQSSDGVWGIAIYDPPSGSVMAIDPSNRQYCVVPKGAFQYTGSTRTCPAGYEMIPFSLYVWPQANEWEAIGESLGVSHKIYTRADAKIIPFGTQFSQPDQSPPASNLAKDVLIGALKLLTAPDTSPTVKPTAPRPTAPEPAKRDASGAIIPTKTVEGKIVHMNYGLVADDFAPELPDPSAIEGDEIKFQFPKSSPKLLVGISIRKFIPYSWRELYDILYHSKPDIARIISQDYEKVKKNWIMECFYSDMSRPPYKVYWYKSTPEAADPAALKARFANHPLSLFGAGADRCPNRYEDSLPRVVTIYE